MLNELLFVVGKVIGGILILWVVILVFSFPIAYFEGTAKADFLKQTKKIEMHWYKAAWLPDEIFIDANIRMNK